MIVQISGQYGDPKAADVFFPFQRKLNELFKFHVAGAYANSLAKLSIVFRVSGSVRDFGAFGPERLKYLKKDAEITVDLVFSDRQWRGQDLEAVKEIVKNGVEDCLRLIIDKAEAIQELVDKESLQNDLKKVLYYF